MCLGDSQTQNWYDRAMYWLVRVVLLRRTIPVGHELTHAGMYFVRQSHRRKQMNSKCAQAMAPKPRHVFRNSAPSHPGGIHTHGTMNLATVRDITRRLLLFVDTKDAHTNEMALRKCVFSQSWLMVQTHFWIGRPENCASSHSG